MYGVSRLVIRSNIEQAYEPRAVASDHCSRSQEMCTGFANVCFGPAAIRKSRVQCSRLFLDFLRIPDEPAPVVCFFVRSTVDRQLGLPRW